MSYIISFVVVLIFFLLLHLFSELSRVQKIILTLSLFTFIITAIQYNEYTKKQEQKMMQTIIKFNQNKTIICNGIDVNTTNFSLSIGTYTFIGLKNTPNYGQMISASTCHK